MRIACPGCAAEYDVPDTLLAAGPRPLRCARCGTEFRAELPPAAPFVAAPEPDAVPAAAVAAASPPPPRVPEPEPVVVAPAPPPPMPERGPAPEDEPAQEAPRPLPSRARQHAPIHPPLPRREEQEAAAERGVALAGWAGSLILLATAIWLVYAWRAEIIELWPPAARLFMALGLA